MTKKMKSLGIGAAAFFGLALLIEAGTPTTAHAAEATQQIQGRIVNAAVDRDCIEPDGKRICTHEINGIAISDQGELIDRTIIGNMYGGPAGSGEPSENRGYAVWKYPDGSTMLMKSEGKAETNADGQRVVSGTKTCIEGTGRFANADCTINWQHTPDKNGLRVGTYSGTITPASQS
ncbi:MAG: hypothetical protein AAF495_26075 [Pseudomonadota bacterium]